MKTMPRWRLWLMQLVIDTMLLVIRLWEDKHVDHTDYRMRELNTGLWQGSQSLRQLRAGQFAPMRRQSRVWDLSTGGGRARYDEELLSGVPTQRSAD